MKTKITILAGLAMCSLMSVSFSAVADSYRCSKKCKHSYERVTENCEYAEKESFDEYKERSTDRSLDRLRSSGSKSFSDRMNEMSQDNLDNSRRLNRMTQSRGRCNTRARSEYERCVDLCG